MMCQCRFITCDKDSTLMGMLIMREVMHVWGQEAYGKPVFLPLNFAVNLKQF